MAIKKADSTQNLKQSHFVWMVTHSWGKKIWLDIIFEILTIPKLYSKTDLRGSNLCDDDQCVKLRNTANFNKIE